MKRTFSMTLVASALALSVATPAAGAVAEPEPPWLEAVEELDGALSPDLIERRARWIEWRAHLAEIHDFNGPYDVTPRPLARSETPAAPATVEYSAAVERWRPLVSSFFLPDDVPWAMRVLSCESGGDALAKNPRSTASGLFQHLASYWPERSVKAGWPGADVFDPVANVAVAAWLYYGDGPGHWVCR